MIRLNSVTLPGIGQLASLAVTTAMVRAPAALAAAATALAAALVSEVAALVAEVDALLALVAELVSLVDAALALDAAAFSLTKAAAALANALAFVDVNVTTVVPGSYSPVNVAMYCNELTLSRPTNIPEATYCAWTGHSPEVSRKYYVSPLDSEFDALTGGAS